MSTMGMLTVIIIPQRKVGEIAMATGGSPLFVAFWLFFYVLIGLGIVLYKPRFRKNDSIFFIPILFSIISCIWSLNSDKTITYSFVLLINAISVLLIRKLFTLQELILYITYAIVFLSLISLVLFGLDLEMVKYYDPHNRLTILNTIPIRGLFNHKITAGVYSAIGILSSVYMLRGKNRLIAIFILTLFNLLTGSSTGLGLLFCVLGLLLVFKILDKTRLPVRSSFWLLCIGVCFLWYLYNLYGNYFLVFLGRDPTLTGRVLLWEWGIDAAGERPILGWGYMSYNHSDITILVANKYKIFANYKIPHFHNGYIQLCVDYGFGIGTLLILSYLFSFYYWYKAYKYSAYRIYLCITLVIVLILLSGIFVYTFSRYNDFSSIFLMISIAYVGFHQP